LLRNDLGNGRTGRDGLGHWRRDGCEHWSWHIGGWGGDTAPDPATEAGQTTTCHGTGLDLRVHMVALVDEVLGVDGRHYGED
jgi:hypothetical protein